MGDEGVARVEGGGGWWHRATEGLSGPHTPLVHFLFTGPVQVYNSLVLHGKTNGHSGSARQAGGWWKPRLQIHTLNPTQLSPARLASGLTDPRAWDHREKKRQEKNGS